MLKCVAVVSLLGLAACGSYKAVRPDAPAPLVAKVQNYSVRYTSTDGQKITAVYLNSNSPMTVELQQGSTVESLKLINTWTKGLEYGNRDTRWHVREGFATLQRRNKSVVFKEIIE